MIDKTAKQSVRLGESRHWAPIARPALQEEVVARIKQLIADGVLLPGSRIPERQLCGQLGISRTPLREAYRVLAATGLLKVQRAAGPLSRDCSRTR